VNGKINVSTTLVVESKVLEDVHLVAYLNLQGFVCIPFIQNPERSEGEQARVAFDVHDANTDQRIANGLNIHHHTDQYHKGELVNVREYVKCLKDIRSAMYNMKFLNKTATET
jgi:hypothetical protein